jgi:hypothetical protein
MKRESYDKIDKKIMILSRGTGWKALYARLETGKEENPDLRNVPDSVGTGMTERTTIVKMQEIYAGRRHGVFADARSKHTISRFK